MSTLIEALRQLQERAAAPAGDTHSPDHAPSRAAIQRPPRRPLHAPCRAAPLAAQPIVATGKPPAAAGRRMAPQVDLASVSYDVATVRTVVTREDTFWSLGADRPATYLVDRDAPLPAPETASPVEPSNLRIAQSEHPPGERPCPSRRFRQRLAARSQPPAAASGPVSDYHALARQLVSRHPEMTAGGLLLAAADAQHDISHVVHQTLLAMAELLDDPVLAIDASGSRRLARRLGAERSPSLVPVLQGHAAWNDAMIQTAVPGLCLLASDRPIDAGETLLLESMLRDVASQFAMVVVDGGSINDPLAAACSAAFDGCYIAVGLDRTPVEQAVAARSSLLAAGGPSLGCILTRCGDLCRTTIEMPLHADETMRQSVSPRPDVVSGTTQ